MHCVIFAGGTLRPGTAVTTAIASADMVIAADGGASTALHYGRVPSLIVGDFDSLRLPVAELERQGSQIVRVAVEKDETDTELAVQLALEHGATRITLLGAIGGARFDHTIANILLLADITTVPTRIVDGPSQAWLLRGPTGTTITGAVGDLLSLFPLTGAATGITTTGLYYPLHASTLHFGKPRGISNVLTHEQAEVTLTDGLLLCIHTRKDELQE